MVPLQRVRRRKNLKWSGWDTTGFGSARADDRAGTKKAGKAASSLREMLDRSTGVVLLRWPS